jgi:hypothetical protein
MSRFAPFSRPADRVFAASRFQQKGEQKGVAGIGGLLGGILGGDNNINNRSILICENLNLALQ